MHTTEALRRATGAMSPGPGVTHLRGLAAARLMLAFYRDPVAAMDAHAARRPGPILRITPPPPFGRHDGGDVLVLLGARHNRDVLMATDVLRPTGIWPVRGPEGSAQQALRRNYLVMHGAEHTRFSTTVDPLVDRRRVAGHFAAARAIAAETIAAWPRSGVIDLQRPLRDLAQSYAFTLLFREADRMRALRFGGLLAAYHSANWSRAAALLPFDLPGLPYRTTLRLAEALLDILLPWLAERRGCPADADVRAALGGACAVPGAGGVDRSPAAIAAAAHAAGFALASYETTATTLGWALLLLACHPEIQAALTEEIAGFGALDAATDLEALAALPLLDAVIKETLRLVTPVPLLGFRTVAPTQRLAGLDLPAGTTIVIAPHLTHRDPAIYPEPRRFRPERWATARPTTYEYLPFSGGPRRCPGYHFALMNLRIALCTILARHAVALPEGARHDARYMAVTVPRGGLALRLLPAGTRVPPPARPRGSVFRLFDLPPR